MRRTGILAAGLWLAAAPALQGQVGYPPESSPYRDIRARHIISLTGGYIAGSSGTLGIGPADGRFGGLRFDLAIGGPTDVTAGFQYARLQRLVIDPGAAPDVRVSGPVTQSVAMADVGLNILLTGRKTWNGLAPYLGAAMGIGFGSRVPTDSSGFTFKAKFYAAPVLGVRWYPIQRLMLRVEGRDIFWQLKYPARFFEAPARAPDTAPVLNRESDPDTQWVQHPTLILGLGYAFRF